MTTNTLLRRKTKFILFLLLATSLGVGCAALQQIATQVAVQKPDVQVVGARLQKLSFTQADLNFDVAVKNPNAVGIHLKGFHYDFILNGHSLLSGNKSEVLDIPANGTNKINIPVSLSFADVYKTYQSLKDKDTTRYQVKGDFSFQLPVLGLVKIPASKSGTLPLAKIPKIGIKTLRLKNLSFTKADLELVVKLTNPNGFTLNLNHLAYAFKVAGRNWLSGQSEPQKTISAKGENDIILPITLHFADIGMSFYNAIMNGKKLPYDFSGKLKLSSSLPVLKNVEWPFQKSGQLAISR